MPVVEHPPHLMPRIADMLREALVRQQLTVPEAAKRIGVTLWYLQNLTDGEANPTLRSLERVCYPLGVDPLTPAGMRVEYGARFVADDELRVGAVVPLGHDVSAYGTWLRASRKEGSQPRLEGMWRHVSPWQPMPEDDGTEGG